MISAKNCKFYQSKWNKSSANAHNEIVIKFNYDGKQQERKSQKEVTVNQNTTPLTQFTKYALTSAHTHTLPALKLFAYDCVCRSKQILKLITEWYKFQQNVVTTCCKWKQQMTEKLLTLCRPAG